MGDEPVALLVQEPAGVIEEISPRDAMYEGDARAYLESGRSALFPAVTAAP